MLRHLTVLVTIPQIRNIKRNTHHKKLTKVRLILPPHRELVWIWILRYEFRWVRLRYLVLTFDGWAWLFSSTLLQNLIPTAAQGTGMAEK